MTSTRALVVAEHGGPEAPELTSFDVPDPGPGEARIEVRVSGLNFIDTYQREGVYPIATPFVLGCEGAGVVESVGEGVTDVRVGQRVAWCMDLGAHADLATVPAAHLVAVPDEVSDELAAAVLLQGMTAQFLTTDCFRIQPGRVALVHAAAGGVGHLLTQLMKNAGGTVVATAGGAAKVARARELGADHALDYTAVDDLSAAIREASGGGVHVAYDGVGKATFDASVDSLRPRGTMVLYGAASGAVDPVDPQRLNKAGSLFLTRPTLAHYIATPEELRGRVDAVFGAIAAGELDVEIGGRWPLDDFRDAYAALEGRRVTGKILLTH